MFTVTLSPSAEIRVIWVFRGTFTHTKILIYTTQNLHTIMHIKKYLHMNVFFFYYFLRKCTFKKADLFRIGKWPKEIYKHTNIPPRRYTFFLVVDRIHPVVSLYVKIHVFFP